GRPKYALIFLGDRPQSFVNELLDALPAIRFGNVDVAFGIGGDAVRAVEFSRLASALSKSRQHFQGIAQQDVDAVVLAVGQVNVFLLRVLREGDVPCRTRTQRAFGDESFLNKGAVRVEHLDAVIHTVTDIYQAIDGHVGAMHGIAKLLRGRRIRIVVAQVRIVGFVSVGAP